MIPASLDAARFEKSKPLAGDPGGKQSVCGQKIRGQAATTHNEIHPCRTVLGVTLFSKGGRKGLWPSNAFETDERLCICEASIDALSYAALRGGTELTRFVSIGGQLNPDQPVLIAAAIEKLPRGEVVLALDNDAGGDQLAEKLTLVFEKAGRSELVLRVDVPPVRGEDWNKVLMELPGLPSC